MRCYDASFIGLVILVSASVGFLRSASAEPLTDARFEELHSQLQPAGDELWQSIPWKIALLDAQRVAARENKPIFIWAMDGHPLGCT
ncbi:MAG: hypothetical protein R3E01_24470 [Pirellulaceae bacterium]|nr:hypothetical protein [Planctomycetales bacterium]